MVTSIGLNIITGRTGTAHVSSSDDAAIWRGFVGNDKMTLHTDHQLDLDYTTKGVLAVSDGVFCIGGRMGRVSNTKTVEYGLPASGYYRRTLLLIRYDHDTTEDTETMTLLTLQNDPTSDTSGSDGAASAAELTIATDKDNDFILYDFVCDEDGIVSGTLKKEFVVMDTVPTVSNNVSTLENHLANEVIERSSADTSLCNAITATNNSIYAVSNRVAALEATRDEEDRSTYRLVYVSGPSQTSYARQLVLCKPGITYRYAVVSDYNDVYGYTVSLNESGTTATVNFNNVSGGSAEVIGKVIIVP